MKTIYTILISFILGLLIGLTISLIPSSSPPPTLTGQVTKEQTSQPYSYTTAICNNNNECIDVLVECENGNILSLTPSSKLLNLGPNFEDFREKKDKFCV